MRKMLSHEVLSRLRRLTPFFEKCYQEGLRYGLISATFILTVLIATISAVIFLLTLIALYIKRAARIGRAGLIISYRRIIMTARALRQKEKEIAPQAIEIAHKVEVAVKDAAIRTAPQAKKAFWSIGRALFMTWITLTAGSLFILIFASK